MSNTSADFEFREELEEVLVQHGIDKDKICLVGSVVLSWAGIRANRDIDLVVDPEIRGRITLSDEASLISPHVEVVGKDWAKSIGFKDQDILYDARYHEYIRGFKSVRIEILFSVMVARRGKKATSDIRLIEKHSINAENWDWNLVMLEINAQEHTSLKQTRLLRFITRIRKALGLLKWIINNPRASSRWFGARIKRLTAIMGRHKEPSPNLTPSLQSQLIMKVPTSALLGNQFADGEFLRYDVLMRYLTIQSIVQRNEKLEPYYLRMQNERVGMETIESLHELVKSVQQKGFLSRYSVTVTEEGFILDGAHRLACALYFDVDEVAVTVRPMRQKVYYGRQWFEEHGFDEELLILLDKTKDALFQKHGVWFPVILWPPVQPYFNVITEEIRSRFIVKWDMTMHLGNELANFARRIYSIDDIERWKVELKIHKMKQHEPLVHILALEIQAPQFRDKKNPRTYISSTGESLKKWIRDSYKHDVPGYFYDIVCHTGDNHEHNRRIFEIVDYFKGK